MDEIRNVYGININAFYYHRIKLLLKYFISKARKQNTFNLVRPLYPFHLKVFTMSKQGCQKFYQIFSNKTQLDSIPLCEHKWENLINTTDRNYLENIFKACSNSVLDNSFVWFQYKILFNILPTRDLLYEINVSNVSVCVFCHKFSETIMHLFMNAPRC